ncbi:universal stress protein [Microbacterium sp. NPDC057407]|uniref:universal stress protein n=1 Tax=Microbacterium sp. NPDC057407 TaxID=3346120 RepID=UPI00366EA3C1
MERILVGYDAGKGAEAALDWVIDRALRRDLRVEVVIVTNPFLQDRPRAEEQLAQAEQRLRTQIPGLAVETARIDGTLARALTDAAADSDLLVIGIDSDRPVREALHGWLSLRISAKSPVPTCIVPAGWSAKNGPVTLALATDGSSERAEGFAAAEAAEWGENLRVVHAWSVPITTSGSSALATSRQQALMQHRDVIERSVERIRHSSPGVTVEPVLIHDNAVAAVAAAAADSSLVVMGTHGRGVLAGGVYGSVGQDLIGTVHTPIVVVPAAR